MRGPDAFKAVLRPRLGSCPPREGEPCPCYLPPVGAPAQRAGRGQGLSSSRSQGPPTPPLSLTPDPAARLLARPLPEHRQGATHGASAQPGGRSYGSLSARDAHGGCRTARSRCGRAWTRGRKRKPPPISPPARAPHPGPLPPGGRGGKMKPKPKPRQDGRGQPTSLRKRDVLLTRYPKRPALSRQGYGARRTARGPLPERRGARKKGQGRFGDRPCAGRGEGRRLPGEWQPVAPSRPTSDWVASTVLGLLRA